jgi:ribonuclease P protein component
VDQRLLFERRLHHPSQFRAFFKDSTKIRCTECIVYRVPNNEGHFRLGITMKAKGTSTERNRVRRAVRETFRKLGGALGSFDYNVVIPQTKSLEHPYAKKLRDSLNRQLREVLGRAETLP